MKEEKYNDTVEGKMYAQEQTTPYNYTILYLPMLEPGDVKQLNRRPFPLIRSD